MKSVPQIPVELDLNLLRVLVALDGTRNVSRAAEVLAMSQSGFSTALLRLRRHFGDEMFIRAAGTMQPTARAQRMLAPAREVLCRIHEDILEKPVVLDEVEVLLTRVAGRRRLLRENSLLRKQVVLQPADPFSALLGRPMVEIERELVRRTLAHCSGNRTRTAEMLGIGVRTLFNKLQEPVPPAVVGS